MKILVISESPLDRIGTDYYAVDPWVRLPIAMAGSGDEITLWSPLRKHPPQTQPPAGSWIVDLHGVRFESHDVYSTFAGFYKQLPRKLWQWKRRAAQLVASHDVTVLRLPSPMTSLIATAARTASRPLVLAAAGDILKQSTRASRGGALARKFNGALLNAAVRREVACGRQAALVLAYSRELAGRHFEAMRVIMMQDPHLSAHDIVDRGDTCTGTVVNLLRVCWLIPSKGIDTLLRAVAVLKERGLPVRLELVGQEREQGYQAELVSLAASLDIGDAVNFTGWVPFDRIAEPYLRSDIQVVSSLAEGTPRCIVEGAARGLPLVTTAVGGIADWMKNEENALLIAPGDPVVMADAIERLITDGELRHTLVSNGYRLAYSATFEELGGMFLEEIRGAARTDTRSGGRRWIQSG